MICEKLQELGYAREKHIRLAVRPNHHVRVVVPGRWVVMALPAPYEGLGGYGKEEK
jgi:hypothetical protein